MRFTMFFTAAALIASSVAVPLAQASTEPGNVADPETCNRQPCADDSDCKTPCGDNGMCRSIMGRKMCFTGSQALALGLVTLAEFQARNNAS